MPPITVTFTPHAVNGWFLKLASRPIVSVDGQITQGSWGVPIRVEIATGEVDVAVGVKYRWFPKKNLLGPAMTTQAGARLVAANGALNSAPFELS